MMKEKDMLARPDVLLIDDHSDNVDKFKAAGGQAIKVSSYWNTPNLSYSTVLGEIRDGLIKIHNKTKSNNQLTKHPTYEDGDK